MANDFDEFPFYDPLVKQNNDKMSDIWTGSMSTFYQTLISYLTQYGIFIPRVTAAQRNSLKAPQEGQLIYNSDNFTIETYLNGAWRESLSPNRIYVPNITATERAALANVSNGQLIYNTTVNKFQGYENGSWQNLI